MAKPKNKSNRKKGAVAGMSTTVCCIVLLMVVVGGFIGYNYMTGGSLWGAPVTPPPDNGSVPQVNNTLPVTTAPEDDDGGEDDPLYYIFGFSFQWDDLLDPGDKCDITIALYQAVAPYSMIDQLVVAASHGDGPIAFVFMNTPVLEGALVTVRILNEEGYQFIVGGLTQISLMDNAGPHSITSEIGKDGLAAPIVVGDFFGTWELVP